ncbi:MAG: adenylate cyclase [Clostridia bacterium]|nr:adenylate cyclase [Clostridia bacterium]
MNRVGTFLKHYWMARHLRFNSREELERYQKKRILKFLREIIGKSEFYRSSLKDEGNIGLDKFPILDKQIMMDNFDNLNTLGIKKDEAFHLALKSEEERDFTPKINGVTVGLSSGTSGNRGLFLVSDHERMAWAGSIIGKVLPSSLFFGKKQKIAFFLRANSNLYTTLNSIKISFKFFDLLEDMDSHIEELNYFKPTILVAPPSMLRMLAKAQTESLLSIHPVKIVSVAEVLDFIDKRYIEKIFNQTVHQVYQCTEGFLGYTCCHGTLHLNEDAVFIEKEYIDKELGKFVPIITDFNRRTQPMIRYRLNDILTVRAEPCECGSLLTPLEFIEGRCDDLFYFEGVKEKRLIPVFPDFLRRAVITASDSIEEYVVIQEDLGLIKICLAGGNMEGVREKVEKNISDLLVKLGLRPVKIVFIHNIHLEKGRKLRRIERRFKV